MKQFMVHENYKIYIEKQKIIDDSKVTQLF